MFEQQFWDWVHCVVQHQQSVLGLRIWVGPNVTTPGTKGCWATGGLVIDNSATTPTGASQVYFVGLAGNTAANLTSCTTGGTNIINATQASQANP